MRVKNVIVPFMVLLVCGCATDGRFDEFAPYQVQLQLKGGLVAARGDNESLSYLQVSADGVRRRALFEPDEEEAIDRVFTDGRGASATRVMVTTYPKSDRATDVPYTLRVIDIPGFETTSYQIGGLFGAQAFGPDNRYLILYHNASDRDVGTTLFNPNEVAVLDLTNAPGKDNPNILSVDSGGHTIERIFFLDKVKVGNTERRLVAFVAEGLVRLVDFADEQFSGIDVKLKNELTDGREVVLSKLMVVDGQGEIGPQIFAMSPGATELFAMELFDGAADGGDGFHVSLNLLDEGFNPADFQVVEDDGQLLLVMVGQSGNRVIVFDVATSASAAITLDNSVNHLTVRGEETNQELVIYGDGGSAVYTLGISGLQNRLGDNLGRISVPAGINSVTVLDADRLLVSPQSSSGLVVVNLKSDTVTNLYMDGVVSVNDGELWNDTLFMRGYDRVSLLNLRSGHPADLVLDEPAVGVYLFPSVNMGLVMHSEPTGRATLFPLDAPIRDAALISDGFYVNRMMDEEGN